MSDEHKVDSIRILGVPISRVDFASALETIAGWVERRESSFVCACDVHSLMRARSDPAHKSALEGARMVTPDGQPLVWTAQLRRTRGIGRVCGPDLLPALCERSVRSGWRHYFYGGAEGVAEELANRLSSTYPGLVIAGVEAPPFRPLDRDEHEAALDRIKASRADIVWVGLGCPKQEAWMFQNAAQLDGAVLIGIGAAFDFHSGRIARAPRWMQRSGLEWMHRLASEPRRLWRRYLILAVSFAVRSSAETIQLRLRQRSPCSSSQVASQETLVELHERLPNENVDVRAG